MLYGRNSGNASRKKLKVLEYSEKEGFTGRYLLVTFDNEPTEFIKPTGFDRRIGVRDIRNADSHWECKLIPSDGDTIEDILIDIIVLKEFEPYENACEKLTS